MRPNLVASWGYFCIFLKTSKTFYFLGFDERRRYVVLNQILSRISNLRQMRALVIFGDDFFLSSFRFSGDFRGRYGPPPILYFGLISAIQTFSKLFENMGKCTLPEGFQQKKPHGRTIYLRRDRHRNIARFVDLAQTKTTVAFPLSTICMDKHPLRESILQAPVSRRVYLQKNSFQEALTLVCLERSYRLSMYGSSRPLFFPYSKTPATLRNVRILKTLGVFQSAPQGVPLSTSVGHAGRSDMRSAKHLPHRWAAPGAWHDTRGDGTRDGKEPILYLAAGPDSVGNMHKTTVYKQQISLRDVFVGIISGSICVLLFPAPQ